MSITTLSLYDYQEKAAAHLVPIIGAGGAALDASDTGTGKTFTALGVAALLKLPPLIICPKSIKTAWRKAAEALGVKVTDVVNIEQLKTGKTPYLKRLSKTKFVWTLPRGSLVIYDECQSAGGYRSENGKILALCKSYGLKVLCLSATVADNPLRMRSVGYLLGLHKFRDSYSWCLENGCYKNRWGGLDFPRGPQRIEALRKIHGDIFPGKGYRVRIKDLPGFPDNSIFAEAYDLEEYTEEINEIYDKMEEDLQDPEINQSPLTIMLRARQKTELFKVPLLRDMTLDLLDEGKSVVIFVNFRETLGRLAQHLSDNKIIEKSMIYGDQKELVRDEEIRRFQANETRVCLCMIQAGGVGLSLHDMDGEHPRIALLTPTFHAVQMKQALGRIHRVNGKSKCIQKILFAADTVEERACHSVKRKLQNISLLNDGDLTEGIRYVTERKE